MSGHPSQPDHLEIQELLGAYALDAVDPETAALVEGHLEECVRCSIEVAQHHEVAGLLANSGGTSPADLWDGIARQLDGSAPPSWEGLAGRLETGDDRSRTGGRESPTVVPITRAGSRRSTGGPGRSRRPQRWPRWPPPWWPSGSACRSTTCTTR